MVDAYPKWPGVHIIKDITTGNTIFKCRQIFASYGLSQIFITDNFRIFISSKFKQYKKIALYINLRL